MQDPGKSICQTATAATGVSRCPRVLRYLERMGENGRSDSDSKRTKRFHTGAIVRAARASEDDAAAAAAAVAEATAEWEDGVAAGTPQLGDSPTVSRTATVHDPLTTALLAEVARQTPRHPTPPPVETPADTAAPAPAKATKPTE
jgi:hypothetical protein